MANAISLKGKCALVTGANSGIGFVTAKNLASMGARVILACRSKEKAETAIQLILDENPNAQLQFLKIDLANLTDVRRAAEEVMESEKQIDILINNAGLFGSKGLTKDGFEMHFATNHLGPYLFTRQLLPTLKKSPASRIVIVSSHGHYTVRSLSFDSFVKTTQSRSAFPEYAASKLCNILFAKELAEKVKDSNISVYSLHPGIIASEIWRNFPQPIKWLVTLPMISNEEGAITTLYCATRPEIASETGLYYDKCKPRRPSHLASDKKLAEQLWIRSAEWAGLPSDGF